ncbi:MAG: hypothetical protein ACLQBX_20020 [Candidatus Limnocylindrales bacterium]
MTEPAPPEYHSTWAGWTPPIGALLASGVEPLAQLIFLPVTGTPGGWSVAPASR